MGAMRFATTRWSVVLAAAGGAPSEQADRALAELCAGYWYPLYAYVRRRGYDAEDARDLSSPGCSSCRRPPTRRAAVSAAFCSRL